jgi:hypothetical protein
MLPYDCDVDRNIAQEVIDCIAQALKDTACLAELLYNADPCLGSQSRRQRRLATTVENDKDLQSLICSLVRMNKAGRNYLQADSSNAVNGLAGERVAGAQPKEARCG